MENFDLFAFMARWKEMVRRRKSILQEGVSSYGVPKGTDAFLSAMTEFVTSTKKNWSSRYPTNEAVLLGMRQSEIDRRQCTEILWGYNFPYFRTLAAAYPKESQDDLIISIFESFDTAIERFNPEKGVKFLTFCSRWVTGSLKETNRKNMAYASHYQSTLDAPPEEGGKTLDTEADDRPGPSALVETLDERNRNIEIVRNTLPHVQLTARQADVIDKIYYRHMGITETARSLGIDPTSVRDAERGALKKMKKYLEKQGYQRE